MKIGPDKPVVGATLVVARPRRQPVFVPLCSLRKAMVIPRLTRRNTLCSLFFLRVPRALCGATPRTCQTLGFALRYTHNRLRSPRMISLSVYLTAKEGREAALETAIKERSVWIANDLAMTQQPRVSCAPRSTPPSAMRTSPPSRPTSPPSPTRWSPTGAPSRSASTGSPATSTRRSGRRSSSTAPTSPTPSSIATRLGACK